MSKFTLPIFHAEPLEAGSMIEAALGYAEQGFFVIPLHTIDEAGRCTCRERGGCARPGKHPDGRLVRNGAHGASKYPRSIERWWAQRPLANIGIVCGPSGLIVLDVDPRNGGVPSFERLRDERGVPETLVARSGGHELGQHHIFRAPDRVADLNEVNLDGIDVLNGMKHFVASPSLHVSGRRYSLPDPDVPIADAPSWLTGQAE